MLYVLHVDESRKMNIALITARGGSKGLPRKNILSLGGKPLIAWTIQAALKSNEVDRVYVSTEDLEIANISRDWGAEVIPRPASLAEDTTSSEAVVEHAIAYFSEKNLAFETIVLLQPTSPLRTCQHIDNAFELYRAKKANLVLGVFEPAHTPLKAYIELDDGSITGLFTPSAPYTRRQDLPRAFQPNGSLYIFGIDCFLKDKQIPRDKVVPFVMSEQESADIDTLDDLLAVERTLRELTHD
ncbi:N-acylneuraminate cytidylyltransferase (CMP-N-acetylneuraminic acid synthetase; CMP-NeuNAc synthetase; CMP-sialic acid synthetase) [Shewanella benthica]|uniref:N-acylneuraminate cytidylyltransferase (CMP-N-acetylneuraminic acid synthetase CMP-NeuNAc synthetase CMP-sialic acid synthetase) n=1 Tax=Shewanella benthica TaxID=43661 RepID=A0A330M0I4_9GAMM|nr:acylneuraminate cytidylyltransferase family protein [Shewanella benthica]SQH74670.1 N-acylneuraminate cytidylyltransferase (CMP-N-acetylneuraminic acid synthetase; CMP-NeuNAc synthetase; CMP-sialic acid synthetase) [Shewanella benthica]